MRRLRRRRAQRRARSVSALRHRAAPAATVFYLASRGLPFLPRRPLVWGVDSWPARSGSGQPGRVADHVRPAVHDAAADQPAQSARNSRVRGWLADRTLGRPNCASPGRVRFRGSQVSSVFRFLSSRSEVARLRGYEVAELEVHRSRTEPGTSKPLYVQYQTKDFENPTKRVNSPATPIARADWIHRLAHERIFP